MKLARLEYMLWRPMRWLALFDYDYHAYSRYVLEIALGRGFWQLMRYNTKAGNRYNEYKYRNGMKFFLPWIAPSHWKYVPVRKRESPELVRARQVGKLIQYLLYKYMTTDPEVVARERSGFDSIKCKHHKIQAGALSGQKVLYLQHLCVDG